MPNATVSCFLSQISPGMTLLYWGYVFACLLPFPVGLLLAESLLQTTFLFSFSGKRIKVVTCGAFFCPLCFALSEIS